MQSSNVKKSTNTLAKAWQKFEIRTDAQMAREPAVSGKVGHEWKLKEGFRPNVWGS